MLWQPSLETWTYWSCFFLRVTCFLLTQGVVFPDFILSLKGCLSFFGLCTQLMYHCKSTKWSCCSNFQRISQCYNNVLAEVHEDQRLHFLITDTINKAINCCVSTNSGYMIRYAFCAGSRMSTAKSCNLYPDFSMQFLSFHLFTGLRCFYPSLCSEQLNSVAYSMVSFWGSATNTCCAGPFRCTVKATLFHITTSVMGSCSFGLFILQFPGTSSIKGWDFRGVWFPAITIAYSVTSVVCLMTVCCLLFDLLSHSSTFCRCCWRDRTFWRISCGIFCHSSGITCSVLTVIAFRSVCCWLVLPVKAERCCLVVQCC